MDSLPPEMITQIIESLPADNAAGGTVMFGHGIGWYSRIANFSSISPAWKASVERLTFRTLTITTDELDDFAAIFSGTNISRWSNLTSLTIRFILPDPTNGMSCCAAGQILDREADSTAFSATLIKLFTILALLESRAIEKPPIMLSFYEAYRRSRWKVYERYSGRECHDVHGKKIHYRNEIREAKDVSGQFVLLHEDEIPTLGCIKTFDFKGGRWSDCLKDLKLTWIPILLRRLPGLETFSVTTEDSYNWGRQKRIMHREGFANAICTLPGDHLREIRLQIYHTAMENEDMSVHQLVNHNTWENDSWSKMFKHLASFPNLAVLHLLAGLVICPEFFRSIIEYDGKPFPALVELELAFAPETADGRWFHKRDDDAIEQSRSDPEHAEFWEEQLEDEEYRENDAASNYSNENVRVYGDGPIRTGVVYEDIFRTRPDPDTFLPFIMDASRFVTRVASLQKFILKVSHDGHDSSTYYPIVSRIFELWYLKAGMPRSQANAVPPNWLKAFPSIPADARYVNQNRLYWRVGRWKPWDEVQAAWSAAAGPHAKIVFLEEEQFSPTEGGNSWRRVYNGEF